MTRAQDDHDAQVRDASSVTGQRPETRRRPLPRSASMTDEKPGPGLGDFAVTAADIIAPLTAPTDGVRPEVDAPRHYQRGRAANVDWDIETGTARNTADDDIAPEGEQLLDVSGDERLVPGGQAEQEWAAKFARHRPGTWPRDDSVDLVNIAAVREGAYGPA